MTYPGRCSCIERGDILPRHLYELVRPAYLREIIELKRSRRIPLGDTTLLFECRETVLFHIHEIVRAESLTGPAINRAIAEYRCLLPEPGRVAATLFIDGGPPGWAGTLAQRISSGDDVLGLLVGDDRFPARVAAPTADPACPVHYLTFTLDHHQRLRLLDTEVDVSLELRDSRGRQRRALSWATRWALSADLRGPWSRRPLLANVLSRAADQDGIACAWVVHKPSAEGVITSLELFSPDGDNVALLFANRKAGGSTVDRWKNLLRELPELSISATGSSTSL